MIFDMRAPEFGADPKALYTAALDQAQWADRVGIKALVFAEHHAADDGYLPSPIVMASAAAGRTKNCALTISVLLLPLLDPIKVAEDLAVLDLLSNGRLRLVVGAGYREEEYAQFGLCMNKRPSLMEDKLEVLKQAWTGEPFEYEGSTVRVLPRPAQQPRPRIMLGGASAAAARRAARLADGFRPIHPKFMEDYREELKLLGKPLPQHSFDVIGDGTLFTHVTRDPEAAWQKILPHALHETNVYAKWGRDTDGHAYKRASTLQEVQASGVYKVLTPQECVEHAKRTGMLTLKPLMGGLDPDFAWDSLHLIEKEVLPKLGDMQHE